MRERRSTSVKNAQSQSADPLIALVRLLARQAAAEVAGAAPVTAEAGEREPGDRE